MSRIIKVSVILGLVIMIALGVQVTASPASAQTGEEIDPTTGLPPTETTTQDIGPAAANADGGNILWDTSHGIELNYSPSGRYSELTALLVSNGFSVDENSAGVLNVSLNNYDIIVISLGSNWNSAYSAAEITAIEDFVNAGGGLLVMSDNAVTPNGNINSLTRTFGTLVGLSSISPLDLPVTDLVSHPIFAGVSQIFMRAAGEISQSLPSVDEVAFAPGGEPVVTVAEVGAGRVVIVGDINLLDNDFIDRAGANNQLFATNVFDWLVAPQGGEDFALQFDGADDFVSIRDTGDFDFDTSFTIEARVKPRSLDGSGNFKAIVQGANSEPPFSGGGWVMFLERSDYSNWGLSVCVPSCTSAQSGPGGLIAGEWQHLAATYDGTNIIIYRNGVRLASTPHSGNVSDVNFVLLGIWETAFNGIIDEVRVWNIARTQTQIRATMDTSLSGSEPGLVGYWPANEGAGQSLGDASSNGNNGRLGTSAGVDSADPVWVPGALEPVQFTSSYVTTPPAIDGVVGFGEWQIGNQIPFGNGFVTLVHDRVRLYVLIDVLEDSGNDAGVGDFFWLTFDVNQDGAITPNVDLNYAEVPSNGNMRYQYYLGPGSWTGLQPDTRSARAKGFGCFFADGTLSISFFPLRITCSSHRVWELGIDLDEIDTQPGGTARMGFRVASGNPSFTDNVPANFSSDFSNLIEVTLSPPTDFIIAPNPAATLDLETNPVELTQAIQDRQNTLPLVQKKDTVARVYADVDGFASAQPSKVYLYGSRGGVDLPGSPLAHFDHLPVTINREQLNDTSNFSLPSTWPQGTVQFSARVRDLFGNEDSSTPFNKAFTKKEIPTYWVVPINTGSNASPNLPSNTEISSQESYTETVYPVEDIKWVRKPWQVIGPTTVNDTIDELNQYYSTVVLAWLLGVLFGGGPPFDLPDQIYGFTPSGGGISDPTWFNSGLGRVSRGFRGTSREGTLAHEIAHNLDRSSNGTWGRHVPNGCGAGGPDPNWPYANDDIQEVGFDTRLPWVDGSGTRDTVIPDEYPDYMSYCQSDDLPGNPAGQLPTKWVSPYRWQNQFNSFASVALAGLDFATIEDVIQQVEEQVFYISGQVNADGTGELNPILVQPGIPMERIRPGEFAIEVHNSLNETLLRVPFDASFINIEGEEVDTVHFNFHLPAVEGAAFIRLLLKDQVLDEIAVSRNAPTVELLSPNGGEQWSGLQKVAWQADDRDGDELSFALLYTPDDGRSWFPIASSLSGDTYEVDTSSLPGGRAARIRIIATDGFNNAQDDSDGTFVLVDSAPQVVINSPADGAKFLPGETILFEGEASDAGDETLPEEAFAWTVNGEAFASGRQFEASLTEGTYEVTLTVEDSSGNSSGDTVQIQVVPGLVAADVAAESKEVIDPPGQINQGELVEVKVVEGLHNFGPWDPKGLVLTQVWETLVPPPACQASVQVTPNLLTLVETFGGPLEITFDGRVVATNPPVGTVFEAEPGVPVDLHFKVGLPVRETVSVEELWGVRCHQDGTATFQFHKEVMVMDQPNVGDPNLGNNVLDVSFSVEVLPTVTGICGDQNGDREVNVFDAIIDLQIIVELITPTPEQLVLSDVVRDGEINIFDVILTLQHIVGLTQITQCGPPQPNG